jgi:TRIAD3 protein (E3 ubiquitin-protein ligase RNF216)
MHIQEHGATQTELLVPPTAPGSPHNHQLTPQLEDGAPAHELPPSITPSASEVAPESHERLVERVRDVVPDVLPAHVFKLLAIHETAFPDNLLDIVIDTLLEDQSYPKDIKGKAKARAVEEEPAENSGDIGTSADYMQLDSNRRLGAAYRVLCLARFNIHFFRTQLTCIEQRYLRCNFPTLDDMHILEILSLHSGRYAPAYIYLLQHGAIPTSALPIAPNPGKKKRKGGKKKSSLDEEEFLREHTWLIQKLEKHQNSPVMASTTQDDAKEEGDGIECGCCFSNYPFVSFSGCETFVVLIPLRTRWLNAQIPTSFVRAA